jgi:hypothetical protein
MISDSYNSPPAQLKKDAEPIFTRINPKGCRTFIPEPLKALVLELFQIRWRQRPYPLHKPLAEGIGCAH